MEKKKVGLLRRPWRKLFRKETHGIIRVEQDGTIHIYGDVMVHGNVSCGPSVREDSSFSESDISFRKKTHRTIYEQKLDDKVGLYSDSHYSHSSREVVR